MPSEFTFNEETGEIRLTDPQLRAKVKARMEARKPFSIHIYGDGAAILQDNCGGVVSPNAPPTPTCDPGPDDRSSPLS